MGTLSLEGTPHVNRQALRAKGFTDADIAKVEQQLPQVFEISFAFNRFVLGDEACKRLGFTDVQINDPAFSILKELGFTDAEIEEANVVVCGRLTIEGAPHVKHEHLAVFDCANKCGKLGKRFIAAEGHIRMMGSSQPFISGAISKTINLPNEATIEDIKNAYFLSWKLALKANALYRDGCKMSQALNTSSESKKDEKDAPKVEIVEKVVYKEVPRRRKLPDERMSITHKFSIAGHDGYAHVGLYDDGTPGEIFIKMNKEGTMLSGVMDAWAVGMSMNLQYGVPLEVLCAKMVNARFEPSGFTPNAEIPMAKSIMDYLGRWLALKFLTKDKAMQFHSKDLVEKAYAEGTKSKDAFAMRLTVVDEGTAVHHDMFPVRTLSAVAEAEPVTGAEAAKQQGYTGSACSGCGSMKMKRNGSCEVCLDCGATSGCS
jgi:ribonucleoside-diphosphate reductase alpha chain